MPRETSKQLTKRGKDKHCPCPDERRVVKLPQYKDKEHCVTKTVHLKADRVEFKTPKCPIKQDTICVRPGDFTLVVKQPDFHKKKDRINLRVKREKCDIKCKDVEVEVEAPNVRVEPQNIRVLVKKGKYHDCPPEVEVHCDKPHCHVIEGKVTVKRVGKTKVYCEPVHYSVEYICGKEEEKEKKKYEERCVSDVASEECW